MTETESKMLALFGPSNEIILGNYKLELLKGFLAVAHIPPRDDYFYTLQTTNITTDEVFHSYSISSDANYQSLIDYIQNEKFLNKIQDKQSIL